MLRTASFLDTEITFLKGVGPERAKTLVSELNIRTFSDLLHHFPFRYIDRTKFYKIKEINQDMPFVQFRGKIVHAELMGANKGKRLVAEVKDETGSMELVWFKGIKWVAPKLKPGTEFIVFGKPALLAVPTPDHYFPLLYILGLQEKGDPVNLFNEGAMAGSLTMTSVRIG